MKTSTERMIAKKDGAIGWMQFNNPARHNAVSVDMWSAVPEIMSEFASDDQIRVVVLSGAGGKAFVSGADISEFGEKRSSPENVLEYNRIAGRANAAIIDFAKPTIAMIQGYCIGGGLGVALCCDLRLAAENSPSQCPQPNSGWVTPMTGSSAWSTSSVHPSPRRSSTRHDSSTRRKPWQWGWSIASSRPRTSRPMCATTPERSAAMHR